MNPNIAKLQLYPFERLSALLADTTCPSGKNPILWSIGEPKHPAPEFVLEVIKQNLSGLSNYPLIAGLPALREAIVNWLCQRFLLPGNSLDSTQHVLPVNGTREALFAIAHCLVNPVPQTLVLMPNPFYQIYEGAALLAGAKPYFINLKPETFLPDFESVSEETWQHCQLLYICTPGNPGGAVFPASLLKKLIQLADKFDFVIASDECYSEIYSDENNPPYGLLQAAAEMGRTDYKRCLAFHSLSKRSSLPGMRSGFVVGDAEIITNFKLYRAYHGCAMSLPYQMASIAAWSDEAHVIANRALYRKKFSCVLKILADVLPVKHPAGGFYLWTQIPGDDQDFCRRLYAQHNLTLLPGSYLARESSGINPGYGQVRMALVASLEECIEGTNRLRDFLSR